MAAKHVAPPTREYILALWAEKKAEFAEQDDQIRRMREVRELRRPVRLENPVTDVEWRDPDAASEIQRRSNILAANPPALHVTPPGGEEASDKAQQNATLREHWTEETLKTAGTRLAGMDTWPDAVDCCTGDGGAWTKLLFQRDLWDERYSAKQADYASASEYNQATEDVKKDAGPPFVWMNVDPLTVYPTPSQYGNGLSEVIEVTERPVRSAFRQYRLTMNDGRIVPATLGRGQSADEQRKQAGGYVTFIEYWDDTWCAIVIAPKGESGSAPAPDTAYMVKPWKHGYGRVPYFQALGLKFGYWRNRKVGWGVAEIKRWLVEYRSYLLTVHAQLLAIDAAVPLQDVSTDAAMQWLGTDGKPKQAENWKAGQIMFPPPGHEIKELPVRGDLQSLMTEIKLVSDLIEQMGSPKLPAQLGAGMEGAGFAIAQIIAEFKLQDDAFVKHLAQMLHEVTDFLWHLVRSKVKESVYVQAPDGAGLVITPDDLKSQCAWAWDIDPERPTGKLIDSQYHVQQVAAKFESQDMAIKDQGRNPDEVRRGLALDDLRQSDLYKQWQQRQVAEAAGLGELLTQDAQADQVAATGQLPPEANPGSDLVEQGAAGASSAMGLTSQEQRLGRSPGGGVQPEPIGSGYRGAGAKAAA